MKIKTTTASFFSENGFLSVDSAYFDLLDNIKSIEICNNIGINIMGMFILDNNFSLAFLSEIKKFTQPE